MVVETIETDYFRAQGLSARNANSWRVSAAPRRLARAPAPPPRVCGLAELFLEQVEVADDDGQQVVEVVRKTAGELSHALQFLRLLEHLRGSPLLGALLDLAHGSLNGRNEASPETGFQQEVRRAALQRFGGSILADITGREDERQLRRALPQERQSGQPVKRRQVVIGDNQVRPKILVARQNPLVFRHSAR